MIPGQMANQPEPRQIEIVSFSEKFPLLEVTNKNMCRLTFDFFIAITAALSTVIVFYIHI